MPIIELDPADHLPFEELTNKLCTRIFSIKNPNEKEAVVFRVRPTSKNFIIQPKVGVLQPNQVANIEVLLQPKNDKFRIIAAPFNEQHHGPEIIQDQKFWDDLEDMKKDTISEKRLKCIFTSNAPISPLPSSPTSSQKSSTGSITEQDLSAAKERIKKLELLIKAEKDTQMALETSLPDPPIENQKLTSGIIPKEMASPIFFSSPTAMFPPLLVFIMTILAYLVGKILL